MLTPTVVSLNKIQLIESLSIAQKIVNLEHLVINLHNVLSDNPFVKIGGLVSTNLTFDCWFFTKPSY